mmetsp:Transcript_26827/g.62810  ORF Transcript_26827/g.62810 Transcript_26827/m.62810 type:complete len:214 (-) Transcript_26827:637-1278(-)
MPGPPLPPPIGSTGTVSLRTQPVVSSCTWIRNSPVSSPRGMSTSHTPPCSATRASHEHPAPLRVTNAMAGKSAASSALSSSSCSVHGKPPSAWTSSSSMVSIATPNLSSWFTSNRSGPHEDEDGSSISGLPGRREGAGGRTDSTASEKSMRLSAASSTMLRVPKMPHCPRLFQPPRPDTPAHASTTAYPREWLPPSSPPRARLASAASAIRLR